MNKIKNNLYKELLTILGEEKLTALFQPIINLNNQQIYGYEGLIRGPSDSPLHAPEKLFQTATQFNKLVELDFLCRKVIISQFTRLNLSGQLFLNISPASLLDPHFVDGQTARYLDQNRMSPHQVVIEVTESHPIETYQHIENAIDHYRNAGFIVAIDDLGAGYSGLKLWSEMNPDFVKIDRHFITNINEDRVKRQFVSSIISMALPLGCHVIAEGIETKEECSTLRKLGAEFAQGYYFGKPSTMPATTVPQNLFRSSERGATTQHSSTASELLKPMPAISPHTLVEEVAETFIKGESIPSIAVIDDGKPIGIVRRIEIMDLLASRFGRELNGHKPIFSLMNKNILCCELETPLDEVSRRVTNLIDSYTDEFILTDEGQFAGKGTMIDLLKQITDLQIETARHANPLTLLPGNVPIQKRIDHCIENRKPFIIAYCDLDNFKPYNDVYGYAMGDEVIQLTSAVFKKHLNTETNFIGHIGGDDFILIIQEPDWEPLCKKILETFENRIEEKYTVSDQKNGYLTTQDRFGKTRQHPLVTLSIGIVKANPQGGDLSNELISEWATKAKSGAKKIKGHSVFIHQQHAATAICSETVHA